MRFAAHSGSILLGLIVCTAWSAAARAADSSDRLTLMASGSTLTGASDGGGGAIGWLHNFDPTSVLGAAFEYQTIADARWKFGSLSGSLGRGRAEHRSTLYAELHEGSGDDRVHSYDYSIVTAGLIQNLDRELSLQLEDKRIDIDTTHGNLPKLGLQYLWSPRLLSSLSYSYSVSGNLGTRLWAARLDHYGKALNLIAGGATGKASPAVINLQTGLRVPGLTMHEGFVGVSRPFSRAEITLLGDYLKISDTRRVTVTLSGAIHLRGGAN
jgi:hypothetical protein